jgi:hypothetical protein
MAHAENFPDAAADEVVKQIGALLPGQFIANPPAEGEVTLSETFEVWILDGNAVTQPTDSLRQLARPTGYRHHQVFIKGAAKLFARSTPPDAATGRWRVTEVFESELAGKIDEAIDLIDSMDRDDIDDPLVRLLIAPTYQTHAFWLLSDTKDDQVLVLSRPPEFTSLRTDQLLSQGEFLEALRGEQHIIGRLR